MGASPGLGQTAGSERSVAPDHPGKSTTVKAIDAMNALGTPVKTYQDENAGEGTGKSASADEAGGNGTCRNGIEYFVPDRNGDPSSTETLFFYDAACTQLARDVVRKWTSGWPPGAKPSLGPRPVTRRAT